MQLHTMQKQEKRRELRLKRFWRSQKATSSEDSIGYDSPQHIKAAKIITQTTALISSIAITTATTSSSLTTIRNDGQSRYNHLLYTSLSQKNDTKSSKSISGIDINVHDINTDIDINTADDMATTDRKHILSRLGKSVETKPTCSLPLLQVWPSQDSPRGEADGQSFIFPILAETSTSFSSTYNENGGISISPSTTGNTFTTSLSGISNNSNCNSRNNNNNNNNNNNSNSNNNNNSGNHLTLNAHHNSLYCDTLQAGGDSGIDSVQASPSPNAFPPPPGSIMLVGLGHSKIDGDGLNGDIIIKSSCNMSPATTPTRGSSPNTTPKIGQRMSNSRASISVSGLTGNDRRKSSTLLHPDHARLVALRMKHSAALERSQTSPDQTSIEDATEFHDNGLATNLRICSASSSTTSSLTSVAAVSLSGISMISPTAAGGAQQRVSDPWLQPQSDRERDSRHERRRSSTISARYSLFDALDLEYALLRAAARGSVGPYSLSESIHKLTFTQSLAFPALARGLASKRRHSATRTSTRPLNPNESGLNTCAKVITAIILVAISLMVFFIVYKFVRT